MVVLWWKTRGNVVKVRCPNCNSSGSVKDRLIPEGGRWIKCPVCRERFFVEKEASDPKTAVVDGREGRGHTYSLNYDPTYHLTDVGDPESEDLFLYWWFFGF
jgi:hypothetical protein